MPGISRSVTLATLLVLAGTAQATLKSVEEAYELALQQVSLPGTDTGALIVRTCPGCKPVILRVGVNTRYILRPATTPVTRSDFAAGVAHVASRSTARIFVYYEPQTGNVRRVVLQPGR
jgi:hypothetical protein